MEDLSPRRSQIPRGHLKSLNFKKREIDQETTIVVLFANKRAILQENVLIVPQAN